MYRVESKYRNDQLCSLMTVMQISDFAMPSVEKRLTPMCFFRARVWSNFSVAILKAYFDVNMILYCLLTVSEAFLTFWGRLKTPKHHRTSGRNFINS